MPHSCLNQITFRTKYPEVMFKLIVYDIHLVNWVSTRRNYYHGLEVRSFLFFYNTCCCCCCCRVVAEYNIKFEMVYIGFVGMVRKFIVSGSN